MWMHLFLTFAKIWWWKERILSRFRPLAMKTQIYVKTSHKYIKTNDQDSFHSPLLDTTIYISSLWLSVQINCCPVKGRDRFRHPHQRARLAAVQLPACSQGTAGLCWPLLTLTPCPHLAWVNAGGPGWGHRGLDRQLCTRAGAHALTLHWHVCAVSGKSQVWGSGLAVVPFPMHVPADWQTDIGTSLSRDFEMSWAFLLASGGASVHL